MYLDAIESLICSMALMIAQTSAVNTDESGNLMESTVSDGKPLAQAQYFHPVNHLYFFRCTTSRTIFGGLMHQGGKKKYEGVSKMSEKSMLKTA